MEIIKNETIEEREGRDGRTRTSKRVEWFVVDGNNLIGTFRTWRMAKAFVLESENKKTN